ncbi:1-(5-phosphoribosyl)-5-[(5-phosphoribosylamino)methylideneamino]imidazole-4-carboxamide isomerase [Verrucomicrobiota bacterium]
MIIIPAIDLKDGRCVRLCQGKAEDVKVYSENPVEMARYWAGEGADYLHIVDLDGAFQGKPVHTEIIAAIAESVSMPIEVGGGLRTNEDIRAVLDCGAKRAIIGTRAVKDIDDLKELAGRFGEQLAVGIDARDGMVLTEGWVKGSEMNALDLALDVNNAGVKTLICTDTAKDGMMVGTNTASIREICENVSCNVIASGGITSASDVKSLVELRQPNLIGAIVGKALYEKEVSLKELSLASEGITNC